MASYRKADSKGRVVLGSAEAGKQFLVERTADGGYVITPVEQKVRLQEPVRSLSGRLT